MAIPDLTDGRDDILCVTVILRVSRKRQAFCTQPIADLLLRCLRASETARRRMKPDYA